MIKWLYGYCRWIDYYLFKYLITANITTTTLTIFTIITANTIGWIDDDDDDVFISPSFYLSMYFHLSIIYVDMGVLVMDPVCID